MSPSAQGRVPLWIAVAASFLGAAILIAWFPKYWPMTRWTVLPRVQLLTRGRDVSTHFGLNTNGWKESAVASVSKSLAHYAQIHPDDSDARRMSPLSLRIRFAEKQSGQVAEVGFDSAGLLVYWRAPEHFKPSETFASDQEAAAGVFRFMAGPQVSAFTGPVHSMGEESQTEEYAWKTTPAPRTEVKESIKVVTKNAAVESAERKAYLYSDDEGDSDNPDRQNYWNFLAGTFGLLCTAGTVAIVGIYVLWITRREVNHRFPIRISVAGALLMFSSLLTSSNSGRFFGALFTAAAMLCFVAVGRGISPTARPKWMSLEQLCLLAPIAKSTGGSLAAGVLLSPLLVAIPFLIVGGGLFPHSWIMPLNLEVLYSRAPLLDSLRVPATLYFLGFFGFAIPAFKRIVRSPWLFWLIVAPVAAAFFAEQTRVVSGPLAAPLTAGFLTFTLFWFAYAYFDLLSVLTLHFASGILLTALMLVQKGGESWAVIAALGGLLVLAYLFSRRGQPVSEGDPRAAIPALVGFRAEREKLRAEFSVARRAQESMLPQTPPDIPGYSIAASCTPSLEVGGDLYDFFKLPDGRIGIGVADVSGKGVPAALYMTLTKGLMSSITKTNSELPVVVEEVNRHLHGVTHKKVFVTMALGFLDAEKRVLEYVRAGHNPVVWRQPATGTTTLVAPGGLGLGITASRVFSTQLKVSEMALSEGDAVVFYSDGITEAMNSTLEQFGEQRLIKAVEKADHLDAAASRDSILAAVKQFLGGVHPQDDMTLVVLRVGAS